MQYAILLPRVDPHVRLQEELVNGANLVHTFIAGDLTIAVLEKQKDRAMDVLWMNSNLPLALDYACDLIEAGLVPGTTNGMAHTALKSLDKLRQRIGG